MLIVDYAEATELSGKSESERAKLLCFYYCKEMGFSTFSMAQISEFMGNFGFSRPNVSRLKTNLIKGRSKAFLESKIDKGKLEFIPVVYQFLDKEYGNLWRDTTTVMSNSELIDEVKFCGKRNFLDRLIKQINFTYGNNCYDACAVLMRRLFEVLLILTYIHMGIESDISRSNGDHFMLDGIVKDAVQNKTLNIPSRISRNFDSFREVGNNSAHSITYTAGRKDIDDIQRNYRVMMEDLYNRAGLL